MPLVETKSKSVVVENSVPVCSTSNVRLQVCAPAPVVKTFSVDVHGNRWRLVSRCSITIIKRFIPLSRCSVRNTGVEVHAARVRVAVSHHLYAAQRAEEG